MTVNLRITFDINIYSKNCVKEHCEQWSLLNNPHLKKNITTLKLKTK